MSQPDLILYHFPGACSQSVVYALEKAGATYRVQLVDMTQNAHNAPEHLAISPMGKVPVLTIDGEPLLEHAAILTWIDGMWPDAGLFPANLSRRLQAEKIGAYTFVGGTLHPLLRGMLNPQRITAGADLDGVREMSRTLYTKSIAYAEQRLASHQGWWLGQQSAIDVYLNWVIGAARNANFDFRPWPTVDSLNQRLLANPVYARVMAGEDVFRKQLGL